MKRGTLDHPKLRRLARLLDLEPWGAAGILESLWHWTSRYARRGDVGRYPDQEIAEGIGWVARPASELLDALVAAGWLDRCTTHRLVIHDVADHADHAWRESMRGPEGAQGFVKPCAPCAQGLRASCASPVPVPVPVPEPLILGSSSPSRFTDFWAAYPKKRHRPAADRAWQRLHADAIADQIVAGVARWKDSEQWLAGRVEDPATFLNQRQWEDPVPPATRSTQSETARLTAAFLLRPLKEQDR